ncbi:MAG TPA: hypothetical protein VIP05_17210 [Burkholderiaceae bacterium]
MKALAAALLCGGACAQDSRAVCLSFCDADAKTCREPPKSPAWTAAEAVLSLHGGVQAAPASDREKERQVRSQRCGDARQACRRKCAPPDAAPAAVTASSASAPG